MASKNYVIRHIIVYMCILRSSCYSLSEKIVFDLAATDWARFRRFQDRFDKTFQLENTPND